MSGIDGTGGNPPSPPENCEMLVIDTQVVSPKAIVIASIVVGDVLDVALEGRACDPLEPRTRFVKCFACNDEPRHVTPAGEQLFVCVQ